MFNTSTIPARSLQKSYKTIIEGVKNKKQAVILTTNEGPQAAIISLEDLERLKSVQAFQTVSEMLKLANESREELKSLSPNLRKQADEILYGKHA
jgi:PHD/YefM family antitoxin component YafN of YafNO toxin-antitoxin module